MSWKIPTSIRKVFDAFPLKVNEPVKLNGKLDSISDSGTHVYVYNIANGICTDPHCLEIQSLLKLRDSDSEEITISAASVHVSPVDTLPFIVENPKPKPSLPQSQSKSNSFDRLQYLRSADYNSQQKIYSSLIETWLRSCWVVSLLDPRNSHVKDSVYILEQDRVQLPSQIIAILSNQINQHLIQELEPQYLQLSSEANSYKARIVGYSLDASIVTDVFDRAEECLSIFNDLFSNNEDHKFLGNLVDDFEISRLDILLFSYTHLILTLLPSSQLAQLIPPSVQSHAGNVYDRLFR